jgi:hypothetical protein
MFKKKYLGFANGVLGKVVSYDFLTETFGIMDDRTGEVTNVEEKDVELLEFAFSIEGEDVYDKDVLSQKDGNKTYLVEKLENGKNVIHLVDSTLEIISTGKEFTQDDTEIIEYIGKSVEVISNAVLVGLYTKELEEIAKFNIKVVKYGEKFFYACNNKSQEEIDLIEVIYVGHHLLEEAEYFRQALTYEEYVLLKYSGAIVEVDPRELQSFVMNYKGEKKVQTPVTEIDSNKFTGYSTSEEPVIAFGSINKGEEVIVLKDLKDLKACNECDLVNTDDCECKLWK